jgi:23S rRNA-/tRNA-specific pseudouridylate synthase
VKRVAIDPNGLAALDKPEGVLSHPNGPRDQGRSLVRAPYDADEECFEWGGPGQERRRLWLINRLDSATSGLILAATSGELAREVRSQFKRRMVQKTYQALVFGKPRHTSETWKDMLEVRKQASRIRTAAGAGRLPAESRMTLVRADSGTPVLSLIQLEPRTGRSHQLRVQCAKRGLPIVGDQTYGNFAANRAFSRASGTKRMFLHSLETSFEYVFGGRTQAFSAVAPLPAAFERKD